MTGLVTQAIVIGASRWWGPACAGAAAKTEANPLAEVTVKETCTTKEGHITYHITSEGKDLCSLHTACVWPSGDNIWLSGYKDGLQPSLRHLPGVLCTQVHLDLKPYNHLTGTHWSVCCLTAGMCSAVNGDCLAVKPPGVICQVWLDT